MAVSASMFSGDMAIRVKGGADFELLSLSSDLRKRRSITCARVRVAKIVDAKAGQGGGNLATPIMRQRAQIYR